MNQKKRRLVIRLVITLGLIFLVGYGAYKGYKYVLEYTTKKITQGVAKGVRKGILPGVF